MNKNLKTVEWKNIKQVLDKVAKSRRAYKTEIVEFLQKTKNEKNQDWFDDECKKEIK